MVCDASNTHTHPHTLRKSSARELISEDQTARVVSQEMASGHASGTSRRDKEREREKIKTRETSEKRDQQTQEEKTRKRERERERERKSKDRTRSRLRKVLDSHLYL